MACRGCYPSRARPDAAVPTTFWASLPTRKGSLARTHRAWVTDDMKACSPTGSLAGGVAMDSGLLVSDFFRVSVLGFRTYPPSHRPALPWDRGRDAGCPAPPAQMPASGFPAPSSSPQLARVRSEVGQLGAVVLTALVSCANGVEVLAPSLASGPLGPCRESLWTHLIPSFLSASSPRR